MAHIDPANVTRLHAPRQSDRPTERFKLRIHDIAPEAIVPLGDRYVVEVIELDETIVMGSLLVITQDVARDPRDPQRDPTIENRGVFAAVVVTAGNGHLLGLADPKFLDGEDIVRDNADVPMFFAPGDVVLVDHNAKGRALKILGRECRIVNQIDVLAHIDGVRLERHEDAWTLCE